MTSTWLNRQKHVQGPRVAKTEIQVRIIEDGWQAREIENSKGNLLKSGQSLSTHMWNEPLKLHI